MYTEKLKVSSSIRSYYFYGILLACLTGLLSIGDKAHAAPAAPIKSAYTQPSGTVFYAQQHGDEIFNWTAAVDGAVIAQNADGYWTYAVIQGNQLIAGPVKYAIEPPPSTSLTFKDVLPLYQQNNQLKNAAKATESQALRSPAYSDVSGEVRTNMDLSSPHPLLVLLVEFNDIKLTTTEASWSDKIFGSSGKTVNTFYKEASNNQFYFTPVNENAGTANDGVIKVTLAQNHPNTAGDLSDINGTLVKDALIAARDQVDLAFYDKNHDASISRDELHIMTIVSGQEAAYDDPGSTPSVWGHYSALEDLDSPTVDGVKLLSGVKNGSYTQFGELQGDHQATIGIIVHELGHDLDLPDLYDVDPTNGDTGGVGGFSVMGTGSWAFVTVNNEEAGETPVHFDAWSKVFLGFETPIEIPFGGDTTVTLNAINTTDLSQYNIYKVLTQDPNEYFLLENRQQGANSGFDLGLSHYTDYDGIAIWHIDSYIINEYYEAINDALPKGIDLESFDFDAVDPLYHDGDRFDLNNTPSSNYNDGTKSWISIFTDSPSSSAMAVSVGVSPGLVEAPIANSKATSIAYTLQWDEEATIHYVVLPSEDPEPTSDQVILGKDSNGNLATFSGHMPVAANTPSTITLDNLTASTEFVIYLVSEDTAGHRFVAYDTISTLSALTVGSLIINEAAANDGSIIATQTVSVTDATYGVSVTDATYGTFDLGIAAGDITIDNLPTGLGYTVARTNPTLLTINFTGKATNHANTDDVNIVSITVAKEKIVGATVSMTSNTFTINFNDPTPPPAPTGGGGGGGGAPSPEVSDKGDQGVSLTQLKSEVGKDSSGKSIETWKVDSAMLNKAIESLGKKQDAAKRVVIPVTLTTDKSATVELPADALNAASTGSPTAIISITADGASYDLPVSVLDLQSIAKNLGADLKDTKVNVTLKQVTGQSADVIANSAKEAGLNVVGTAIEFSVTVTGNGKSQEVTDYGQTYVTRTIILTQSVNGITPSVVVYDPTTGKMSFVPATFSVVDGKTFVTIQRNGNSIYTVVESKKTFADIEKHWARADIELLASKALIKGVSEDAFAPGQLITRAQFAAILAQALGLREEPTAAKFSDVKGTEWFAGYVGAAAKAKLVSGYSDGTFHPDDQITREQMAVMIVNAVRFVGKDSGNKADPQKLLAKFNDQAVISKWAKESVLQVIEAGIMSGVKSDAFSPAEFASRAQATTIVKRLLVHLRFID